MKKLAINSIKPAWALAALALLYVGCVHFGVGSDLGGGVGGGGGGGWGGVGVGRVGRAR